MLLSYIFRAKKLGLTLGSLRERSERHDHLNLTTSLRIPMKIGQNVMLGAVAGI